jgi:beta-galactosidase
MKTVLPLLCLYAALSAPPSCHAEERVTFACDFAPAEGWVKPIEQPYRQDICLNGRWEFQPVALPQDWNRDAGVAPELPPPAADRWEATPIKIPSPWNVNTWGTGRDVGEGTQHPYWPSSVYYPSYPPSWDSAEMGWLRRTFRAPEAWEERRVVLHFEAVAGHARVLVNGSLAGENFDSHLPFELDVSDLVKPGAENELLVGVRAMRLFDKKSDRYPLMRAPYPPGSTTDHLCGIWQDVFLLGLPPLRVADVFVKPLVDRDTLAAEITLHNDSDHEQTIEIAGSIHPWVNLAGASVVDAPEPKWRLDPPAMDLPAHRATVKPGETGIATLSAAVGGRLKFWSPEAPHLYGLVLSITSGDQELDRSYTRFGWRQVKVAGKDFLLNSRKIRMFGDLLHPFGPFVNSRRYVWAWYRMIKDMNGNAVRPHAQPHPRHYLDLADEMGLLVLDETALFGSSLKLNFEEHAAWDRYAEHYDRLVLRDRNHPGVFGWSWGNELFAIFQHNGNIATSQVDDWYRRLADLGNRARRLDPTRDWISCDGDEDVRGTMPVWNRHFGHGLPAADAIPRNLDKPLMVGESGGSYYALPAQLASFNGDRAYASYIGRNEALAIDVYDNIVNLALPKLTFYSPAETAWFGLEHLNFGYRDFSRLPNAEDGVWFKPFEDGKPGVQPERIPPYVCTLNPGWDPALPLYKPLPMFEAQKAALSKDGPQPCPWDRRAENKTPAAPATPAAIDRVAFVGAADGELHNRLSALGLPLVTAGEGNTPALVILDGSTFPDELPPAAKQASVAALARQGTVLVMFRVHGAVSPALNSFLPAPVTLMSREATALVPRAGDAWTAGLGLADLCFAEDPTDRRILKCCLEGDFVKSGRTLLEASSTDWSLFNNAPEFAKCAAIVLYEALAKPGGAALVEMNAGQGRVLVSSIDVVPGAEANAAFWRRLFSNAGVRLGDSQDTGARMLRAFNSKGALVRVMAQRLVASAEDVELTAIGEDRFNFDQLPPAPAQTDTGVVVCFSFWLNCPTDPGDPLVAGPDAPNVGLMCYAADKMKLLLNGAELAATRSEPADYRTLHVFHRLPLKKGWNRILIKVSAAEAAGDKQGTLAVRLTSDRPDFLRLLQSAASAPKEL